MYSVWDGDDTDGNDKENESTEEPLTKRKRGGRASKKESFWGKFEAYLIKHVGKNGENLKTPEWTK